MQQCNCVDNVAKEIELRIVVNSEDKNDSRESYLEHEVHVSLAVL